MPKLLILFQAQRPDVAQLAEAAAEGASTVRFAEVDLRRLGDGRSAATDVGETNGSRRRTLERVEDATGYDGIILCASSRDDAASLAGHVGRLDGSLVNKVGSALTTATGEERTATLWAALAPVADRGMIIVPASFTEPGEPAESARRVGKRVAEVIGWVTHARSHHHHH